MWFFTCSTIKTVDDHCGYALPWDPLQHLTSNNAGYHDVHHQSWGIKTNFSQPFFTFWDRLLGTMWMGGDVSARYERARLAAQKKVDADTTGSITSSPPSQSQSSPTTSSKTRSHRSYSATISPSPYDTDAQHASTTARNAQATSSPTRARLPSGSKAANQALASRQQVLDLSLIHISEPTRPY